MADKSSITAKVVDFSNVKDGGGNFNKKRVPAGDYLAKVLKVEDAVSKKDDAFQYLFTIALVNKHTDRKFPYYCKLQENQLWKLRNLLIAAGMNVPKKRMKLDPSKVVGKLIGVTLEDDEYDGKAQSVIASIFPASELAEDSPADDEPEDDEGIDDEEETEDEGEPEGDADEGDEFDSMDRSELKAYLTSKDSEFRAKKSQSDDDLRELARAAAAEDSSDDAEEDADDEEDEEEEPAPAPAKKSRKKTEVTDDELEELDIEDL